MYGRVGDAELRLYLVRPRATRTPTPAILFLHGGSWRSGHPFSFLPHCHYFASRGMIAASAAYRLVGRNTTDVADCVADAQAAVRWLRALEGVDPTRVVAAGHSAGGHLAASTAMLPADDDDARPDALVLLNPVTQVMSAVDQSVIDRLSPSSNVGPGNPPTLIVYGTRDFLRPLVLPFAEALRVAGNRCDLVALDGAHNVVHPPSRKRADYIASVRPIDDFLVSLGFLSPGADVAAHVDALDLFEILGGRSESVDPDKTRPRRSRL